MYGFPNKTCDRCLTKTSNCVWRLADLEGDCGITYPLPLSPIPHYIVYIMHAFISTLLNL